MNVLRNFEAVFVVALGLACAANYAIGNNLAPQAQVQAATQATLRAPAYAQHMPVVIISAKRLSAEQKQQSLRDEAGATLASGTHASKI